MKGAPFFYPGQKIRIQKKMKKKIHWVHHDDDDDNG